MDGTNQSNGTLATANNFSNNKNSVLLQTASVTVSGFNNKRKVNNVQLLFDNGSQRSYIREDPRKKLNLPTSRKENIAINTSGNKESRIQSIDVILVKFILKDRVLYCMKISRHENFAVFSGKIAFRGILISRFRQIDEFRGSSKKYEFRGPSKK